MDDASCGPRDETEQRRENSRAVARSEARFEIGRWTLSVGRLL